VPYATLSDVADLYLPELMTAEERVKAVWLLDKASALVKQQVARVDERLADLTLSADAVAAVVTAMVVRVLRNPDGRRQVSQRIDDYENSWTVDQALSSGALYLSETEFASIAPRRASRTVRSLRLIAHGDR
jgi:hypothetical protein